MGKIVTSVFAAILLHGSAHAISVSFVGANPIGAPNLYTNFGSLPDTGSLSAPYAIDGFFLDQVNGDPDDIWTSYNPGGGTPADNTRAWYPNGGDDGYTQITVDGGGAFQDVALFIGSGNPTYEWVGYEFLSGGGVVGSGVLSGHSAAFSWLSITGGGFDTIRLRDGSSSSDTIGLNTPNALVIDQIAALTLNVSNTSNANVPDSGSTITLLGTVLLGCGLGRFLLRAWN